MFNRLLGSSVVILAGLSLWVAGAAWIRPGSAVSDAEASRLIGGCEVVPCVTRLASLCPNPNASCIPMTLYTVEDKGVTGTPHWRQCDCGCGTIAIRDISICCI